MQQTAKTTGAGRRANDLSPEVRSAFQVSKITAAERLKFARQILLSLLLVCVGVFAGYAALPDSTAMKNIFEVIKIGALPLVTLVISFYFPNRMK